MHGLIELFIGKRRVKADTNDAYILAVTKGDAVAPTG